MKLSLGTVARLLVPLLATLPGCLEVDVSTSVSPDGSSEREISMKCETKELPRGAFPVGVDSTWTVEWKETAEKDNKFQYIARKRFPTPEALHQEYAALPDTGIVGLRVSLEKRFEWFYTYLDYSETYIMRNLNTSVPVSAYMTKEEIERYVRGEQNDTLEQKVSRWDLRNDFEEIYRPLLAEAERRNDLRFSVPLREKKEELYESMVAEDSLKKAAGQKQADSTKKKEEEDVPGEVMKSLADVLHTDVVYSYRSVIEQTLEAMSTRDSQKPHPAGWKNSVQMPGLLIDANSDGVEGNTVTWQFKSKQIHVGDYLMHASSRVTNVWAFVVTGLAALAVVLMGVRATLRRRR